MTVTQTPTTTTTDARTAIESVVARFIRAFEKGDTAAIAALYTEDGEVLPPGTDAVRGRSGIRDVWQGARDLGIAGVKLEIREVEQVGDTAYEIGTFGLTTASGDVADEGKYVVIWKHENGEWRLHRDIWNSSRSATA